jgi:hypothetical protein
MFRKIGDLYYLSILKAAYKECQERLGHIETPRVAKTEMIEGAVNGFSFDCTLSQPERACPAVSRDMIRRVLRKLQKAGHVECLGRGPGAVWRKNGNTPKKGQ